MKNSALRILLKALALYALLNLLLAAWAEPRLGGLTLYNHLFPGRLRFPFGENPTEAYNFSLFDLDAMFASHAAAAPKAPGEYRVLVIGDSSVWGTLLRPEETLAGQLDALALTAPDGRRMRFYNLGYPTLSLTKDLMILDQARALRPDRVIWLTTLEAMPRDKQLSVPLVENNPTRARALLERAGLDLPAGTLRPPGFWERTLIGRRKAIADGLRLQIFGVMWAATGIDQAYPGDYPRAQVDLEDDPNFHGKPGVTERDLALEAIAAGRRLLGETPLLLVNEPILISAGANSDVRYNFYYPRGAYDQYREILAAFTRREGIAYLDAWDLAPVEMFTNSAIHLDARGTARLAEAIRAALMGE